MHIICPNCGLKAPVEAGVLAVETRLVCARCEVEFDIKFTDEQVATRLVAQPAPAAQPASTEIVLFEEPAELPPAPAWSGAEAADVLGLEMLSSPPPEAQSVEMVLFEPEQTPTSEQIQAAFQAAWPLSRTTQPLSQTTPSAQPASESQSITAQLPVAERPAVVEQPAQAAQPSSHADQTPRAEVLPIAAQSMHAEQSSHADQLAFADEPTEAFQTADALEDAEDEAEAVEVDADVPRASRFERMPAQVVRGFDKYSVGARLMRVSPVWLLVAGLSFISFIVLCNWFFVPANLAQADVQQRTSARAGHSTNQSSPRAKLTQPADSSAAREGDARAAQAPAEPAAQAATQPTQQPAPAATPAPAEARPSPSAEVKTPAPAVAESKAPAESSSTGGGKFTVQVGAYNVASEAEARASSLKSAGVEARVAQVELPKRGTWYRVQAGRFASREEAERHGRQLRDKGLAASFLTAALQ